MRTKYCERCPHEDTNRCKSCDGYGNDIMADKLAVILEAERERIKGEDG